MCCGKTLLQFSLILVEGLIFSPLITYVYYYSKVRASRPMGCTSPPCPVETPVSRLPPFWALVHLMMGTYVRCGRILRASFVAFRCASLRFGVFLCVYVSFHVRIMLFFRAFVCLFRATTAVFNPQTVSSHVVLSLLFSAHSDGLSFFFVLALSLL